MSDPRKALGPGCWLAMGRDGKVLAIDWDLAEREADASRRRIGIAISINFSDPLVSGCVAEVAIAIREYVLTSMIPDTIGDRAKK